MRDPIDVEIRWSDVDAFGHVHHIALIAIAEHARSQWLDAVLESPTTWPYVVVRIAFDYRAQARLEDRVVRCSFKTKRVGNSSVTLEETLVTREGEVVAAGESVIVVWDEEDSRARPLRPEEAERLAAHAVAAA
jgi:acyl-CoA thioester hydrolase